jgi:hypothetical protein
MQSRRRRRALGRSRASEIWKILPPSNSLDQSIRIGPSPNGIVGDAESVWVTRGGDIFTPPAVLRIDVSTLQVHTVDASLGGGGVSHIVPRGPGSLALGAGRVWVVIS